MKLKCCDIQTDLAVSSKKSPKTQAHHLFNLSGPLLLRHWEAHWYNSPFVALCVSWWRGAPRSEDTHFIRQWREQQKPSLPLCVRRPRRSPGSYKSPRLSVDGPRQILITQTNLSRALISAAATTASHISSFHRNPWYSKPASPCGAAALKKREAISVQASHSFCLYWSFFFFPTLEEDDFRRIFSKCGSRWNLLKLPGFSFPPLFSQPLTSVTMVSHRSTKGASKARRDHINHEIRNMRALLPVTQEDQERLSYLHSMAAICTYIRKSVLFQGKSPRFSFRKKKKKKKMSLNISSIFSSHQCQTKRD